MSAADVAAWHDMAAQLTELDRAKMMGRVMDSVEMTEANVLRFLWAMKPEQRERFLGHASRAIVRVAA